MINHWGIQFYYQNKIRMDKMKKGQNILLSGLVATMLFGVSTLSASSNLHDSVSQKEAAAVAQTNLKGMKQAQARLEMLNKKDKFLTKENLSVFKQQSRIDETKRLNLIVANSMKNSKNNMNKTPKDVMSALNSTIKAMQYLYMNKIDNAKKSLQDATKLFDKALKNNPALDLVPVDQEVQVTEFFGDANIVKKVKNQAIKLLKNNNTQLARDLVLSLKDQTTITTRLLPMITYPDATKEALKYLNKNKPKDAFIVLNEALHTVVVDKIIIPLPLVTAQDLIDQASKLKKSNKKDVIELLNLANDELQKDILLGYATNSSSDVKSLQKEIKSILKEVHGKNKVEKLYEHIKSSFKSLVHKLSND